MRHSAPDQLFRMSLVSVMLLLASGSVRAQPEPTASASSTASLTVKFEGVKPPSGTLMVSLDGDEAAYLGKAPAAGQAAVAISGDEVLAVFEGLKPGTYVVRAFQDLNGDGVLNMNPFGIPTEPYAFSNNARGKLGPPKWSDASFIIHAGENTQIINFN